MRSSLLFIHKAFLPALTGTGNTSVFHSRKFHNMADQSVRVFSNVRSVLSQCNTWLKLLHLLYDTDFTHAKQ